MNSTVEYIKEWQKALQIEIQHVKKYGSTRYRISNGHLLSSSDLFSYYFETTVSIRVPVGSQIRLVWGGIEQEGRVLSSEGKSIILSFEKSLGDLISEAFLYHDPWELLDHLISRLDEIKKSKQKRIRVKRLMDPSMPPKHPIAEEDSTSLRELFVRSKYNPITFVWGPPGTGKTYTLARVAANHYFKGKKILLLSHSNQAVDVLMEELSAFVKKKKRFKEGEILRYGTQVGDVLSGHPDIITSQLLKMNAPDLIDDKEGLVDEKMHLKQDLSSSFSKRDSEKLIDLEKKLVRVLEKIRQKEMELVKEAKILGTTLAKAASDQTLYETEFDIVILDEASMAYVPQVAFASSLAKNLIVCGDFKQLPPIASGRHPLVTTWLKEDIFHSTGVAESVKTGTLHPHLFLLKEQRRMHPDISAFTNRYIYNNLVGDHPDTAKKRGGIMTASPFPNQAAILLDTSHSGSHCLSERTSKSKMNPWQLFISFQLIHEAYMGGARSIGYVSPYRAQAALMTQLLDDVYQEERSHADIIAATVHRFQGSERDVMIFDTVDSYPEQRAGMLLTGKDSERLINVAITRTKGKFIQVSDTSFLKKTVYKGKVLRQLVDYQQAAGQSITNVEIGKWIQHHHPKLNWMHARKLEPVFIDVKNARESIVISLPNQSVLTPEWIQVINSRKPSVKLTVISDQQTRLTPDFAVHSSIAFPFIMIDRQYFWLGLPLDQGENILPPYVAARLDSPSVCQQFLAQLPQKE